MSFAADERARSAAQLAASAAMTKLEQAKNRGEDYKLTDIATLRSICQAGGGVTVDARTVGGRDAIFKAAVDAAMRRYCGVGGGGGRGALVCVCVCACCVCWLAWEPTAPRHGTPHTLTRSTRGWRPCAHPPHTRLACVECVEGQGARHMCGAVYVMHVNARTCLACVAACCTIVESWQLVACAPTPTLMSLVPAATAAAAARCDVAAARSLAAWTSQTWPTPRRWRLWLAWRRTCRSLMSGP